MSLQGFGAALLLFAATTFGDLHPTIDFLPRAELVEEVHRKLLPSFPDTVLQGPEDGLYFALSQAQIDDLVRFHYDRREAFPYVVDAWDCDDMAREFLHLSRVWNIRRNGVLRCAPAVGAAYVRLQGPYDLVDGSPFARAYHVINVILRDDGQWFFFEPQSAKLLPIEGPVLYEQSIEVMKVQI